MAIHRLPILGVNTKPDESGFVFPEPYSVKATNDKWKHLGFIFNDSGSRDGLSGMFTVPKGYVGTANLVLVWTAIITSGDLGWEFDYRAIGGDDSESFDQSTAQETIILTDTAPTSINLRLEKIASLTDGNFAVDDDVEFEIFRNKASSLDTLVGAGILKRLFFQYSDS